MTASELKLSKIGQIAMRAKDLARATAFYRDRLGMRYLFSAGPLAFFDCGGIRLMLGLSESAEFDHPGSVLYFTVPDINAAQAALEERGVAIIRPAHLIAKMPDHELWMAFFRDSEDNTLAIMAEVR